jgi:hypothetical protein
MIDWITRYKFIVSLVVFSAVAKAQTVYLSHLKLGSSVTGDIITFLSILFGFYITSLAIFVTSHYVSSLYNIVDKNRRGQTLLHTLTQNYSFGLRIALLSLVYFVWLAVFFDENTNLTFGDYQLIPFLGVLVLNFGYCFIMLRDLISIIIQEAKNRSQD